MTSDAYETPKPAPRRQTDKAPPRPGEARARRAGTWTREPWRTTRERLAQTRLKTPSRKALTWTGAVLAVLAIAVAILVAIWDWNWFRGPVARYASARMHREVTITGDLKVHPWSWQPSATVDGVHVANPTWAGKDKMADIGRIAVRIRLVPLLTGHVDLRLLQFDQADVRLYRDAQGRATWDFSDGRNKGAPLRLPPIRNFIINDGKLNVRDAPRKLTFNGTVNAREKLGAQNPGFLLVGQGDLNRQPFTLRVTGGPLLNIDRNKPYPFDADIRAGTTYVTATGAVPKPFDLGQFYMATNARGQDLADLYGLTGVTLPNTPPYSLRGRLARDVRLYTITGLGGRVGDSDLTGHLSVDTSGKRPMLKANLSSRSLDFDDLGAVFGGAPSTKPGETASPAQKVVARTLAAQQRIFPDSTLNVSRVRAIDADVIYNAQSIHGAPINLRAGSVRVKLNAGLLRAEPLTLDLPQGRVVGYVQLNARKAMPVTDLDLRLSNARLAQLVPFRFQGSTPFDGSLVGRAQLTGTGDSVHKAFANANGRVMVVLPGGEIRQSIAELLGVDVIKGLGLLLSDNQQTTPIRCGVAHFQARNGVMVADQIVLDTGPVLVNGSGTVNLGTERMAFRLQGHPKKFQLIRLMVPVKVEGPIRAPKLGVEPGTAIAQGGAAVALGALLSPLAAILPFVDPGLAKDANCGALLAQGAQQGAPVTAAVR